MFEVSKDYLLKNGSRVPFQQSPHKGGRMLPTCIVLHDTADRPSKFADTVSWFLNLESKVSAHLVLGREHQVTQLVEFDTQAHHAGKSSYQGRNSVNGFGIGIELDNPGKLTGTVHAATAWFGDTYSTMHYLKEVTTKAHGKGIWMPYTQAQIDDTIEICRALVAAYPSITSITTHWEISPGRKVDTNPLLPLDKIRAAVFDKAPSLWPLRPGSRGEFVLDAQTKLIELGYDMVKKADKIYGTQTESAVLTWQKTNGLPITGTMSRDDFDRLMFGSTKAMIKGPATAKAEKKKDNAARAIEVTAVTGTGAVATEAIVNATENVSLWDSLMGYLGMAGEAVTKLSVLGLSIHPGFLLAGVGIIVGVLVWRWVRRIRKG